MASKSPATDPWAEPQPTGLKGKRAAKKAAKAAKEKKTRWYKQIWQVYKMTAKQEPLIWVKMLIIAVVVIGAFALFGAFVWKGHVIYLTVISVPMAALGMMILLARRAQRAAYKQIEGQPGAAYAALGQIRRGWTTEEQPVAVDPRGQDMIFRTLGRGGIVLVGEGDPGRLAKMFKKEVQKLNRVAPGVTVIELVVGDEKDQVPIAKLASKVQRLRPVLSKAELAVVAQRLRSLGGLNLPIPKGVDPMRVRPDRKAMRGR
ncbi:MAG: DUF4191 domain-containing protein [Bifidobacteriaceae bacterium]|jgi:hypothetical protein|nr:DUF4191 domain-containing protein [Bifidobacteriaceae bacterium]